MGSSLHVPAPGAQEKAKTGACPTASIIRPERPGGARSCSPETEERRVGRLVPPPSPGAGPGHPALCAPGYATTPCRCWHLAGNIGKRHSTLSRHPPPTPTPPGLTLLSCSPLPPSVCLYVSRTGFAAHNPAGVPLAVAVSAQPGPGAPVKRKS